MIGLLHILTNHGYKLIDSITIHDKILTYKGTFQEIHEIQKIIYSGELYKVKVKYHPHVIETTKEHLFYVIEKGSDKPIWKKSSDLCFTDLIGLFINKNEIEKHVDWYKMGKSISDQSDIPEWVQDAPISSLTEFITAFETNQKPVSYNIALAIQRIYMKIGRISSVIKIDDLYTIEPHKNSTLIGSNYAWYPIISITNEKSEKLMYSLKMNEPSYISENLII